jgi:capsular exopolysaccharide synthesis family protein
MTNKGQSPSSKVVAKAPRSNTKSSASTLPTLSPREIILSIKERAIAASIIALVVCALIGGWLFSQPKVYQTGARLIVDRNERILNIDQVVDQSIGGGKNDAMFETYVAQITSPAMVQRVVETLSQDELLRIWKPYATKDAAVPSDLKRAVRSIIGGNAGAARQGNTFFIQVWVKHRDPQSAALLASRFANEFIGFLVTRNSLANNSALAFLREQSEELRAKAEASERALQRYREQSGMVSLDESRNIVVDRMKSLSATVTSARVSRLAIEARLRQAELILAGSGDPLELATTAEFTNLASVQTQIDALRTQRTIMGERYGVRHPAMIDNQRSREALEKLRAELIVVAMSNLRNQREKALSEEGELEAQLAKAERESFRLDEMAVQFNVLRREAETNRATYTQVLQRLNETAITAQLESSNIRIVDLASVPGMPIEPDTKKITMTLIVLGLGIFVGYPVGLEILFNRVKSWSDVESYLNVPLLAELPTLKKVKSELLPHLITKADDEDASEAVRSLYAQLKMGSRLDMPKTILVTSTLPSEGKSFVASNLAASFAAHGIKTLLVDTDFRRPTQHRSYSLTNDAGILRWYENGSVLDANLVDNKDLGIVSCGNNLSLLRTGGTTRRSTEILDSEAVHSMLEKLRKAFDVIIIDTPPAGVFPDALSLSDVAGEVVYVVRHNHVSRPAVRRIVERFSNTNVDFAGVVLNLMPVGRSSAAYYSGYGHYGSKYYSEYAKESKAS